MRHAWLVAALLLSGCSSGAAPAAPPPGWSRDVCDTGPGTFSPTVAPVGLFVRSGTESARLLAAHVVEAVGDVLTSGPQQEGAPGQNDVQTWQTRAGFVNVFWSRDPAAWEVNYASTLQPSSDPARGRNATAHAILGSLGVGVDGLRWTDDGTQTTVGRPLRGSLLQLVGIFDTDVEAEQATKLIHREISVSPDYRFPDGPVLVHLAVVAQRVLDCHAQQGETPFHVNQTLNRLTVDYGIPVFVFFPEPVAGWSLGGPCSRATAGVVRVEIDAGTDTVVASNLSCSAAT
ncbi:MAG: hypothetical protein ABR562_07630 [Thermoplasmatota archaeon]